MYNRHHVTEFIRECVVFGTTSRVLKEKNCRGRGLSHTCSTPGQVRKKSWNEKQKNKKSTPYNQSSNIRKIKERRKKKKTHTQRNYLQNHNNKIFFISYIQLNMK